MYNLAEHFTDMEPLVRRHCTQENKKTHSGINVRLYGGMFGWDINRIGTQNPRSDYGMEDLFHCPFLCYIGLAALQY